MGFVRHLAAAAVLGSLSSAALAAEGPSAAGPIGGTDIRSALMPPPGLYAGGIAFGARAFDFVDGQGQPSPGLGDAHLSRMVGGPFLVYVPDVQVAGGSIGFAAFVPFGRQCGHLFTGTQSRCQSGIGDPYVEAAWSRSFATPRPSRFPGALPILEGLTVAFGFGTVLPIGRYASSDPLSQALSSGNNIWDFAPSIAVNYTTPPVLAEGTEFSAKLYWNNYLTNTKTQYKTGDLLSLDFAVTERIGRFQVGPAGFYLVQIADDTQFGAPAPPDGRRARLLSLGGVVAYDMPELGAAVKIKATTAVVSATRNTANSSGIVVGLIKKLY